MTRSGWRAPTPMKTPLFSQSSSGAAVSNWVEGGEVDLLGAAVSPRAGRAGSLGRAWGARAEAGCGEVGQRAAVGGERVGDVAEGGAVGEDGLPVGARAPKQLSPQLGPREGPAGQGHDSPAALGDGAELERLAQRGFEA